MGRSGWRSFVRIQVSQALCGLLLLQSAPAFADLGAKSQERQSWVRLVAAERSPARAAETREPEARPVALAQASPSQQPAFPRDGNGPAGRQEEHGQDTDGQGPGTDEKASASAPGELPPSPPGVQDLRSGVNLVPLAPTTPKVGSTSELALRPGWNLVSLARQPGNPAPASVFSGAASRVFAYDACDATDHWKVWDPANPSGSDLSAVNPKLGLWAEAPAAVNLPVAGTEPATTTIHLCAGWNLIGAPFSQDRSVTGALSSIQGKYARVFGYDAADPADPWEVYDVAAPAWANTLQVFEPGKGYWVFATVETDLVLSNDTNGPVVQITTPADLSEVTTLTNVVGTVSGELIQQWRLAYRALGDAQWTTIGSGTTPVVNGVLGVFDPTLLLNGPYQLELTATDANNLEQSFRVDVAVEGQQKIGNFTLTYQDLNVPLSGLPIQILRIYDSRDKRKGDFGVGWTLDIRQGSYKNNRQPGEGWQFASGFLPCQFIQESLGHVTTIRLSDREIYRFKLSLSNGSPILGGCLARARFDFVDGPVPGATLAILGNNQVIYHNGGNEVLDEVSQEVFEPAAVRLTTRDGRIFDLNLQQGVTRLEDRNGNELSITASGITHSSGRTVTFERDGLGRITRITDPEGESLVYEYDAAGDLVAVTDRAEQATHFTYNATHLLLDIEDARGIKPVRNEYDANGRLLRNIDAFDKVIEYTHDLADRQEVITDRLGHSRVLEYDVRGNVIREVDENGGETHRTFDARDNLLTETDPLSHTLTYTYDTKNNLTSFTDPVGNRKSFTYNDKGQDLTVTDARGKVTTKTYDANGNLLSKTDPLGNQTTYVYDSGGRLLSMTDPEGAVTQSEHDTYGNVTQETDAQGTETTYTYNRNGNPLTKTTFRTIPAGSETITWTYVYDTLGRKVKTTDPDGTSTRIVYGALNEVLETIDKLNRRTRNTYDATGHLLKTDFPDNTFESSTYDAEGHRLTWTDRGGRTTRYEYDAVGQVLKTIYADGGVVNNVYDAARRLIETADARGNRTSYSYDGAGRRTKVRDALGNETTFTYDPGGNTTSLTDAKSETVVYEYDDGGRLIRTRFPGGTSTENSYDRAGRRSSETDAEGSITRFGYNAMGQLTSVTDALNQVTRYAYDEQGNQISQTDAKGHVTVFEYDRLGRLTKRTLPLGAFESMVYDAAGNLIRRTDLNGAAATYEYDLNDRLVQRNYPGGTSTTFTYTATNRRATAVDVRGTTLYSYDARDRLTQLQYPDGRKLEYTYDLQGNRTALTATVGAAVLTTSYAYDVLDRLQTVTDPSGRSYTQAYDANWNRTSLAYPNGLTTSYNYDRLNRLTDLTTKNSGGTVIQSYGYTLKPASKRSRIGEHDGTVRSYEHDTLYRLTRESVTVGGSPVAESSFTYDPAGNRLSQERVTSGGAATTSYSYDDRDRILTENSATYSWDSNGNLMTKSSADGATYVWDFDSRLIRITKANGTVISTAYDADGNRVRTEVTSPDGPPTVTDYLVDPTGPLSQVVAETDASGNVTYYARGNDLLAVLRSSGARFYHSDGLGSIRVLTDESGSVTDTYTYSAFGELLDHTGSDPNAYLYAGEPLDSSSGFYFQRARWMDPRVGRFASVDPFEGSILSPVSLHRYLYASNDPVDNIDPTGEESLVSVSAANYTMGQMLLMTGLATLAAVCAVTNVQSGPDSPCALRKPKDDDDEHEVTLYRGLDGTSPSAFRIDPDGLSVFEYPSVDHAWNIAFIGRYRGTKWPGVAADIVSPIVIPGGKAIYTPQYGPGHWSLNFPADIPTIKKALSELAKALKASGGLL